MTKALDLEELCAYINQYSSDIFVRHHDGEDWVSVSLDNLPAVDAIFWVTHFISRGRIPHRVIPNEE